MGQWNFPPEGACWDKPKKIYYQTMTRKEVEERLKENDIILIPIGATENHGAAGPIGEDIFIVTRMAEMIAERTGCTVAHPISYGSHPAYHLGQWGNVIIPDDVLSAYIRAVMAGFWNTGFRKQILFSMHGQEYLVPSAINEFAKKYQVPAVLIYIDVPRVMGDALKDKAHGGPFDTPFRHADEAETSISLALFPELCKMEDAEDTVVKGFLPEGHVDKGGDIYGDPIPGHCQWGTRGVEFATHPEGVLGKASLADAKKAYRTIEVFLDYMVKLHNDILATFPPGKLPPIELMTQRDREEMEAVIKGPREKGGKHIYTLGYPP